MKADERDEVVRGSVQDVTEDPDWQASQRYGYYGRHVSRKAPGSMAWAWSGLRSAVAGLVWEIVYATKLDVVVRWLAGKLSRGGEGGSR